MSQFGVKINIVVLKSKVEIKYRLIIFVFYKLVATGKVLCPGFAEVCKTEYIYMKIFSISPANDFWGIIVIITSVWLSVRLYIHGILNLGYNVWTKWNRAFILNMCIFCDTAFLLVPHVLPRDLYLYIWPTFDKNLILTLTFQPREIGFSNYIY